MDSTAHVFEFDGSGRRIHEINDRLRAQGPAVRVDLGDGVIAWSVTRADIVQRLAEDERVSRDAGRHWPHLPAVPAGWPLYAFLASPTVLNAYGADHTRLRTIMERAFTAERLEPMRSRLHARTALLLDSFGPTGSGTVLDVREEYATVVALEALCDLFGVPEELWSPAVDAMGAFASPPPDADEAAAAVQKAMGFFGDLLARKRSAPGPDLMSDLNAADLSEEERLLALAVTVAGGVESPTDLITNCVRSLLTHPDQLAAIRAGKLPWSAAIEETLRVEGPVQHMPLRYAVDDIDLGEGTVIARGEAIILGFGAAGRDPAVHGPTAGVFDAARAHKEHWSFGHGVHRCVGEQLGMLEAKSAVPALFARFPDLALAMAAKELAPLPTFVFDGVTALPVHL